MPNWVSNPSAVLPIRRRHDAGVGDDEIERLAVGDERVGAGAHARERGEIELDQLEPAAFRRAGANLCGRGLGLAEIPRRADHLARHARRARGRSRRRGPAETPVTSTRLPRKITPSSTSSVVDVAPNVFAMVVSRVADECRSAARLRRRVARRIAKRREQVYKRRVSPVYIRRMPPFSKRERNRERRRQRAEPRRRRHRTRGRKAARSARASPAPTRCATASGCWRRRRRRSPSVGADVSLDEIARRAGVGIGTLYRHFPTRDAIVEAVYRREVEQLADAANRLPGTLPPGEALHAWMRLFVDYIATKKVIAPALKAMVGGASELYASSGARITDAMAMMVERAGTRRHSRGRRSRRPFARAGRLHPCQCRPRLGGERAAPDRHPDGWAARTASEPDDRSRRRRRAGSFSALDLPPMPSQTRQRLGSRSPVQ